MENGDGYRAIWNFNFRWQAQGLALTRFYGTWVREVRAPRGPARAVGTLRDVPSLVSLTVARTKVSDLSPLKGHPSLERLHIAEAEVTDLSPLEWMRLTRLIFTPGRIKKGIESARGMESIYEIDVEFPSRRGRPMSPAEFWRRYDAGELN